MEFHIGRLGRKGFILSMLASFGVILGLILIQVFAKINVTNLAVTFIFINMVWMIILYIGRLHDVGHSGWWSLLVLPLQGLGLIILAVWRGKKEANKYGEVPPATVSHLLYFWRSKKVS